MLIFTIIMFGLAGVRTLVGILKTLLEKERTSSIIGSILVAITYWWAYIWFLQQFITLK